MWPVPGPRPTTRTIWPTLDGVTLVDVTCSGATTDNLTGPQAATPPQFDALTADTDLVTVTIGGNDAGLINIAIGCFNVSRFGQSCKSRMTAGGVDQLAAAVDGAIPKVGNALAEIRRRSPQARVMVTGYGTYLQPGGCYSANAPVLAVDADYVQSGVNRLNAGIRAQANLHGATYVDLAGPGVGHDVCAPANRRWIEGVLARQAAPLHPNAAGMAAFSRLIGAQL